MLSLSSLQRPISKNRLLLLLFLGAALSVSACAAGTTDDADSNGETGTNTTGTGGNDGAGGGSGGAGGSSCVPSDEQCDGADNNCNGQVDEGCACIGGKTQDCYSGPDGTEGTGPCAPGTQTCDASGKWGPCEGEIIPIAESCNAIDDDCNGLADDNLGTSTCGVGECQVTVNNCENGAPQVCKALQPTLEVCDGKDNNCNQLIDEADPNLNQVCDTGLLGACSAGKTQCIGAAPACVPEFMPSPEICDAIDNDCNGIVDDAPGTGVPCTTGLPGACSAGHTACVGNSIDCAPNSPPIPEICDGLDNDCNDQIDEGNPEGGAGCNTGQPGGCSAGIMQCINGGLVCSAVGMAGQEVCNGTDDNCDGAVDEGNPGGGAACGTGQLGVCAAGTTVCSGGKIHCNQSVPAGAEVCNDGLDNDCNGAIDNGCASACAHNKCVTGVALASNCEPCVTQVCAVDSFCCTTSWDSICVGEVTSVCGISCGMACAHNKCITGAALNPNCDPCVNTVCTFDSYCCTTAWDSLCVSEVTTYCGIICP